MDWEKTLVAAVPHGKPEILRDFALALPRCIEIAKLTTPLLLAHFLAQTAFESGYFSTTVEEASGAAYEGRKDLGNVHPGDGRKYKGRGLIQDTGASNYHKLSAELGVDFINKPALLATFPYAAFAAAIYWRDRDINRAAARDDIRWVTRDINGGENGLPGRVHLLALFKRELAGKTAEA